MGPAPPRSPCKTGWSLQRRRITIYIRLGFLVVFKMKLIDLRHLNFPVMTFPRVALFSICLVIFFGCTNTVHQPTPGGSVDTANNARSSSIRQALVVQLAQLRDRIISKDKQKI